MGKLLPTTSVLFVWTQAFEGGFPINVKNKTYQTSQAVLNTEAHKLW